jgi:CDP-diacylglycerol--glycerol-3-phosphate 3-phosphatidyltransferase
MIALTFIAVVGSLMVSYTRARAEGLGVECKDGLLARPERVIILAIGLLSGTSIWALALLAVFSHVTAIERMASVWRTTHQPAEQRDHALARQHDTDPATRRLPKKVGANEVREHTVRPVRRSVPPFTGGVHND